MKNKKIKVHVQYPWRFSDSSTYKYLVRYPPENVEYLNIKTEKGATYNKRKLAVLFFIKSFIRKWTNKLNLAIPNAHFTKKGNYDLIFCAHCLSRNKNVPWVCDFENGWSLFISGANTSKGIRKVEKFLKRDNCKALLPWSNKTKKEILEKFPGIEDKVQVIYSAVPEKDFKKKKSKDLKLIFSGRYFYMKGGLHALEVIDKLTMKYKNVRGIINSEVPVEIKNKYSKNSKMDFYGLIPQNELFKLYEKSDILVYPGYSDNVSSAFLESMSFGIPIVTVDGDSRKEIVEEGKTGFVIERPKNFSRERIGKEEEKIIESLSEKTSLLIENKSLLEKMSKNCLKEIKDGKFSIKERNKKLRKIYEDALK